MGCGFCLAGEWFVKPIWGGPRVDLGIEEEGIVLFCLGRGKLVYCSLGKWGRELFGRWRWSYVKLKTIFNEHIASERVVTHVWIGMWVILICFHGWRWCLRRGNPNKKEYINLFWVEKRLDLCWKVTIIIFYNFQADFHHIHAREGFFSAKSPRSPYAWAWSMYSKVAL